jgi:hypothetical protein
LRHSLVVGLLGLRFASRDNLSRCQRHHFFCSCRARSWPSGNGMEKHGVSLAHISQRFSWSHMWRRRGSDARRNDDRSRVKNMIENNNHDRRALRPDTTA